MYNGSDFIPFDDRYGTLEVFNLQSEGHYDHHLTKLDLISCDKQDLGYFNDYLDLKKTVICLDPSQYTLRGNVYDLNKTWLVVTFQKCQNSAENKCAGNDEEIDAYLKDKYLATLYKENFLNYTNIKDPLV